MKKLALFLLAALILLLPACQRSPYPSSTSSLPSSPTASEGVEDKQTLPPDERLQPAMLANKDTVAWLTVDGTSIDGPVQQSVDNDYYLRRDALGQYSFEGCYFADFESNTASGQAISRNTIIYGHSFSDDAEQRYFKQLERYIDDVTFAQANRTIWLSLNDEMLQWEIISAGVADAKEETLAITANPTPLELEQIVQMAIDRSEYAFDFSASECGHILTLSTCTGDDATRLLVVARLVE